MEWELHRACEEEKALSKFLGLLDETKKPRYEDRDELVLDCFQELTMENRALVIRALAGRLLG